MLLNILLNSSISTIQVKRLTSDTDLIALFPNSISFGINHLDIRIFYSKINILWNSSNFDIEKLELRL